jgi:isopenicillin N synthase-like dioxygenase
LKPVAHEIPVVDIGPFLDGGDGRDAATAIEAAITSVGFFQVVGHGVPDAVIDDVYGAARALAALDTDTKERFRSAHPYRGIHLRPDESGAVRLERFLAARFDDPQAALAAGIDPQHADYYVPNVWPTEPVGFRSACLALFERTQVLGGALMRLFAVALGLGVEGFDHAIEPNASSFAVNHYPALGGATGAALTTATGSADGKPALLFHEHADGNTLTLLHQRGDYEGLQVSRLDASGEWTPVPVRDDAFVINVGKLMSRWTNDHWQATRHRVVASSDPSHQRTTLTTFHMPALGATIAPLPGFCAGDGPHYEPVTTYDADRASIRAYALPRTDALLLDPAVVEYAAEAR